MEVPRWERIVLYGLVPIVAAILGAAVTVYASRYVGGSAVTASLAAIAQDRSMSPADKIKAIDLLNKNDQQFYDLIKSLFTYMVLPMAVISYAVADWIRSR